jgi:hypothetical protein
VVAGLWAVEVLVLAVEAFQAELAPVDPAVVAVRAAEAG